MTTAAEARQKLAGHTIWLWHYLHADWQWEQSRAWHEDRYVFAVNEALDLMQQHAEIKYYFDTASEFFEPIARKLAPRMEDIRQYVREGRIQIVSAQVANCRPTQVADETYIRNLQIGRAYFEQTLPPTDLSLFHSVDIAIGGTQMPQILKLAGFKYYKAWRPHGPMNAHGIPHQFIWQGLDGSQLLVMRGVYGALFFEGHMPENYAEDWDGAVAQLYDHIFRDQLLKNRSQSRQLWMIQGCDDARLFRLWAGDRPMDLLGLVKMWHEREEPPIHWLTPLEFACAVAEHADTLPVWQGVLDGCDVGYNMAPNAAYGLWRWRQMNDRRLIGAEWWTTAAAGTGYSVAAETWQRLWRQHLTYQAHAQEDGFAEDYAYLVDLGQQVRIESEKLQHDALVAIAQAAGGGDLCTQFVFNPHPWPVEQDVPIYHACAASGVESLAVVDGKGTPLPHQLLRELRHPRYAGTVNEQHLLLRICVPALGYRRIRIIEKQVIEKQVVEQQDTGPTQPESPKKNLPETNSLETAALKLVFRDHLLREVHDKESGAIYYARDGSAWPRLLYHVLDNADWLQGGAELRRESFVPHKSQWLASGPLRWLHRSEGQLGPYQAQIDISVTDKSVTDKSVTDKGHKDRELQVQVKLEGHWSEPPASGYATISGDIQAGGQITTDVPFGVEPRHPDSEFHIYNPPPDPEVGEAHMFERLRPGVFWGRSWADWSGTGRGVTWLSADGAYYWLKEPGLLGHVVLRACVRKPGTWEAFCPDVMTGSGVHTFNYTIRFHDGAWRQADPQRRSAEIRHPLVVARPNHKATATLPANEHSFLAIAGPALLSAYYAEGQNTIIRIVENEGRGGQVSVTLDWSPASAQAIDLLGQVVDVPTSMAERQVLVTLKPWQIATLRLVRG